MAVGINQRAPGIPPVNGCIGLDKILEGRNAQMAATGGTDNTHGHRLSDTQRVADGEYHVAYLNRAVTVELHLWQVFQGDVQECQVSFRVRPDDSCRCVTTIAQCYQDFVRIADHVMAGENIAGIVHNDPGTQAAQRAFPAGLLHEPIEER